MPGRRRGLISNISVILGVALELRGHRTPNQGPDPYTRAAALQGMDAALPSLVRSTSPNRLPPGPGDPAIVQVARYMRDPVGFLVRCRERYGPTFTLRWPGMPPMVYFTEPEPIRAIFRASPQVLCAGRSNSVLDFIAGPRSVARLDGQDHKQRRRGMVSPFTRLGPCYAEAMAANTLALFRRPAGQSCSFQQLSQSLSLRNLIHCALGIEAPDRADRLHDLMLTFMRDSLNPVMAAMWMMLPGVALRKQLVRRLAPLAHRRAGQAIPFVALADAIRQLDELLREEIVAARALADSERVDVLSLLVGMHEELADEDLRDELMAILVAGHETTSTTMDWFVVAALSQPPVLDRLRAEVDRVVGRGPVRVEMLPQLEYLTAVIHECLRLHPPVPAVGRFVARELEIGGVWLPAGVVVSPSIALLHRDPTVWNDPLEFRPERFLDGSADKAQLISFGGGTRTCLGKPFALFQLQVVLATLLSNFELIPGDWPTAKIVQRGLFTGVAHPVMVSVTDRR
jgi:cytochrome P450